MPYLVNPVLGYENFVTLPGSVLSSADLETGSSADKMKDPNLGAVANFGDGAAKTFKLQVNASRTMSMVYLRFRGTGWQDITTIRVRASANSDLSSPTKDTTYNAQFPTTWPDHVPVRPIFREVFSGAAGLYFGIDIARTTGANPLEVSIAYMGGSVAMNSPGGPNGWVCYGTHFDAEDNSEESTDEYDSDGRLVRKARRTWALTLKGLRDSYMYDSHYPKLMYGCAGQDIVYVHNSAETDKTLIQNYTLWGSAGAGRVTQLTATSVNRWEQELVVRERT